MKKFYAFLAAALMSVSVFAAKDVVPSDDVIKNACDYEAGQLCVCIFAPAEYSCNDFVFVGTYNGWKGNAADCAKFVAIEGYDGWLAVAVDDPGMDDDGNPRGIEGKPVLLDQNNTFSWEYQAADITVIRGQVDIVTDGAAAGEIDLKNYSKDAPVVYTVNALKNNNNPCTAAYHDYKIIVKNAGCGGWAVPYAVGAMNNWQFEEMQYDETQNVFYFNFRGAESTPYQVVSGLRSSEPPYEMEVMPGWNDDSYMQKLVDGMWVRMPGEADNNLLTHENTEIYFDLSSDSLRWARCDDSPLEFVVLNVNLPKENEPSAVEIIGGFDSWAGTAMEKLDNGWWHAEIDAKASQFFKFRTGIGETADEKWAIEIEKYNAEDDVWAKIGDGELTFGQLWEDSKWKGEDCKWIELDFSDPDKYRWTTAEQGIENVVLTEKAQKVVVDGVIYIIRNNKMFNIQGAQVR